MRLFVMGHGHVDSMIVEVDEDPNDILIQLAEYTEALAATEKNPYLHSFFSVYRKNRYVYGTVLDSIAKVKGLVKFDLHAEPVAAKKELEVGGNVAGIFDLGHGRFGSEAVFVPREPGTKIEEDDGYLIFFVHDESTGESKVYVIDAKSMSPEPVAVVVLPCRVPYGFHAFFLNEMQLKQQQPQVR